LEGWEGKEMEEEETAGPDLRPALAVLKAWAQGDRPAWDVMLGGDQPQIIAGLSELLLLFVGGLSADPVTHIDNMFRAVEVAERGRE
jgi:hypothetical protein